MRHRLLGLAAVATVVTVLTVTACTDTSPTGTRPTGPNLKIRASQVDPPPGSIEDEIEAIIGFWPNKPEDEFMAKWLVLQSKYAAAQTDPKVMADMVKKLADLTKQVTKNTPKMDDPPTDESKQAAAARLIYYLNLFVFEGPDADPPPYDPEGESVYGTLTPGSSLTLITPSGDAGVHFDEGSVDEDRTVFLTKNTTQYVPCEGPLTTMLCQYPLFYDISSFPDGPLLKVAQAAVCHPEVGEPGGPPDSDTHLRLRLAHPAPEAGYEVPGGSVRVGVGENIEILPLISQTFLVNCEDVEYTPIEEESFGENLFERGVRVASALASRVRKLLVPRAAYAIDQGGGGEFLDFGSPFNNVDPCDGFPGFIPEASCEAPTGPTGFTGFVDEGD